MTFQQQVKAIMDRYNVGEKDINLAGLCMAGEAGEVADNIKKFGFGAFSREELRRRNKEELQDCLWAVAVNAIGLDLDFNELLALTPGRLERKIAEAKGIPLT